MIKSILIALVITIATIAAQAQSAHSSNVSFVTQLYWGDLNRNPDTVGLVFWTHELDYYAKTRDSLLQAFLVSAEYKQQTSHSSVCNNDYTKLTDYRAARVGTHQELLSLNGKFRERYLVGSDFDTPTAFLGNTIKIQAGECTYNLWYDYAAKLDESIWLAAILPNSKSVDVTYDPVSGLAVLVNPKF